MLLNKQRIRKTIAFSLPLTPILYYTYPFHIICAQQNMKINKVLMCYLKSKYLFTDVIPSIKVCLNVIVFCMEIFSLWKRYIPEADNLSFDVDVALAIWPLLEDPNLRHLIGFKFLFCASNSEPPSHRATGHIFAIFILFDFSIRHEQWNNKCGKVTKKNHQSTPLSYSFKSKGININNQLTT